MFTYYWENPVGVLPDFGQFTAADDVEAMRRMPKTAIIMYRESESANGLPFVTVYKGMYIDPKARQQAAKPPEAVKEPTTHGRQQCDECRRAACLHHVLEADEQAELGKKLPPLLAAARDLNQAMLPAHGQEFINYRRLLLSGAVKRMFPILCYHLRTLDDFPYKSMDDVFADWLLVKNGLIAPVYSEDGSRIWWGINAKKIREWLQERDLPDMVTILYDPSIGEKPAT